MLLPEPPLSSGRLNSGKYCSTFKPAGTRGPPAITIAGPVRRPVEGSTYWATTQGAPYGLDYWRKISATRSTQLKYLWNEKRPVAIQIDRDVAIVHFYSLWATVDEGRRVVVEQKRMEVFRKTDGQWHLVAGMSVPTDSPPP